MIDVVCCCTMFGCHASGGCAPPEYGPQGSALGPRGTLRRSFASKGPPGYISCPRGSYVFRGRIVPTTFAGPEAWIGITGAGIDLVSIADAPQLMTGLRWTCTPTHAMIAFFHCSTRSGGQAAPRKGIFSILSRCTFMLQDRLWIINDKKQFEAGMPITYRTSGPADPDRLHQS